MASILDLSKERDAHIDKRLQENIIIWLNSVRPDGRPHAVAVWFLWHEGNILIFSKPNNQKLRNIQKNPNVLLAIDDTHQGADPITIEGTATLLSQGEIDVTLEDYVKKYGKHIQRIGYSPETMAAAYSQAIRITLTRVM
ncbi:MAG TPA: TIGR03667 family PPOX class F420-dependent oxidoreductase [Ktedonobacteraceae bacterium]|nr:TIGR03667 family PPOX class F420-dependent oxidoreductase [Ktedonobacteraceae bacterium]